jgi:histidinol-phosphatase (PHP family)
MTVRPAFGSYHNHVAYCDGSGTVEEYAEAALAAGLGSLGLSSHAPVPFATGWNMPLDRLDAYCQEVRAARDAYAGRLPIFLGLEIDYLAPDVAPDAEAFQRARLFSRDLDYAVLSMHFIGFDPDGEPWAVDTPGDSFDRQLQARYRGDVRRLMEEYWAQVAAMARMASSWRLPVIAGHIDKAKMWNVSMRYFSERAPWWREAAEAALAAISAAGLVVEINTAGLGRAHGESYPGPTLLRRCRELGIPVTISADAHRPADVARDFDRAAMILREAGHREIVTLADGRWTPTPLGSTQ